MRLLVETRQRNGKKRYEIIKNAISAVIFVGEPIADKAVGMINEQGEVVDVEKPRLKGAG